MFSSGPCVSLVAAPALVSSCGAEGDAEGKEGGRGEGRRHRIGGNESISMSDFIEAKAEI